MRLCPEPNVASPDCAQGERLNYGHDCVGLPVTRLGGMLMASGSALKGGPNRKVFQCNLVRRFLLAQGVPILQMLPKFK